MDLRIVKTLREIQDAFYTLRRKKVLGQISVKEIVQEAKINKTTFYRYYENIEQLIDELETREIQNVLNGFQNYALFFQSPGKFFNDIVDCFAQSGRIRAFMSQERTSFFISRICDSLFEKICRCEPIITKSEDAQCILKFFLYGVFNSYLRCFHDSSGSFQIEDCYRINQILGIPILAMMQSGRL